MLCLFVIRCCLIGGMVYAILAQAGYSLLSQTTQGPSRFECLWYRASWLQRTSSPRGSVKIGMDGSDCILTTVFLQCGSSVKRRKKNEDDRTCLIFSPTEAARSFMSLHRPSEACLCRSEPHSPISRGPFKSSREVTGAQA